MPYSYFTFNHFTILFINIKKKTNVFIKRAINKLVINIIIKSYDLMIGTRMTHIYICTADQ